MLLEILAPEVDGYVDSKYFAFCPWCETKIESDDESRILGIRYCKSCKEAFNVVSISD